MANLNAIVLMATYNGEEFVGQQIESILDQKGVNITLRICDDCSNDSTFEICRNLQEEDNRIVATQNKVNLGVANNFMQMIYEADISKYDVVAFSDQDDVWLPNKLMLAAESIERVECDPGSKSIEGVGVPVLYCSDLQNVDIKLNNPVRELRGWKLDLSKRANPLLRNWYSGCTMVMNVAMGELLQSCKYKEFPRMHDAWCAMVAYYSGNFVFDRSNAPIFRRITGQNTIGKQTVNKDLREASFKHLKREAPLNARESAINLLDGYEKYMSEKDAKLIQSFVDSQRSPLGRIKWALSNNYSMPSILGTLLIRLKFLCARF